MARRNKPGRKPARKHAAGKKTSPKKTAAKRKKALVASIGVVTSISLSQELKDAFENALAGAATTISYEPNSPSYNPDAFRTAVQGFNDPAATGLIVTFGGVGTAAAAAHHATKVPWIMLVGGMLGLPSQPSGKFFGGVNLDTYGQNEKRLRHFTDDPPPAKRIPASQICLLYNPNSACSNDEAAAWSGAVTIPAWTGPNDKSQYSKVFSTKIPNTMRVVVISADPYFQETKDYLIDAANTWVTGGSRRRVCYPLQDYSNTGGAHMPDPSGHSLHGPSLVAAYKTMGTKARTILLNGNRSTLTTLPIGNAVDHPPLSA
jgi:hypothetical protein